MMITAIACVLVMLSVEREKNYVWKLKSHDEIKRHMYQIESCVAKIFYELRHHIFPESLFKANDLTSCCVLTSLLSASSFA
jgi:hypothetical protein